MPVTLDYEWYVSTLNRSVIVLDIVCLSCTVNIGDHDLVFDLMVLEMRDFNIILGMD